jgi:hypothetical protein
MNSNNNQIYHKKTLSLNNNCLNTKKIGSNFQWYDVWKFKKKNNFKFIIHIYMIHIWLSWGRLGILVGIYT